ncbi:MAG: virulence RhuM family protein [Opitutaceae bacterium]|nr:virulence RhuM family protein [Opitutaceae bacterium]
MTQAPENKSAIILYQTEDGRTRVQCRFENETVWLTQKLMAELFQIGVNTVNYHLKAIFAEGELRPEATIRRYRIVQNEGGRQIAREVEHYNLDAILAVGFRVRSHRGTQFRQWAIGRLNEYLVKGFTMDDERLKNPPGKGQKDYFDEQLERIRDIRSSERRFYQKVLDIYATSVDYTPNTEMSQRFFATVQNKMHWAAHGHTAAEVIHARVDAGQPFMGLKTTRPGGIIRKEDVAIAKNYLDPEELGTLNRVVNAYIEFAELRALQRKVMTMRDWIAKLDEFLKLSEHELLDHAGTITAEQAKTKAELEYERYRAFLDTQPRLVDADFEKVAKELKKLPQPKPPKPGKKRL